MGENTTEMSFTDVISNMYTSVDKFWELPSGAHHKYVSRWLSPSWRNLISVTSVKHKRRILSPGWGGYGAWVEKRGVGIECVWMIIIHRCWCIRG